MSNEPEKSAGRIFAVLMIFVVVFMIWVLVKYPPFGRGSSAYNSTGSRYDDYEPGTNYRYYKGSNSSSGSSSYSSKKSGSGSSSYSSSKSSGSKSSSKNSSSSSTKKYTPRQKSAKEQAYDDFMDDALEDYLSCVEDMDEYWDAVEYFDEDWLLPDQKEELERLMKSFDE